MSKIFVLVKILLKNGTGSEGKRKRKYSGMILNIFLTIILIMSLGVPLGAFTSALYDTFASFGQEGIVLNLGFSMASLIIFIFGILYVLTTFYFAKDIESFLPLPLKAEEILSAKFITVLVYEYLTELIVLAPVIIIYGIKAGLGLGYWIVSVVIFLLLPVLPLVMASILNMIIMRFTNLGKHKDALRTIGGVLAIFFGVGVNLLVQRSTASGMSEEKIVEMLSQGNNSMLNIFNSLFPTSKLASLSLISNSINKNMINLALFMIITIASVMIFMVLAKMLYFKGVMGVSESFARRKQLKSNELDKRVTENSKIKTYVLKELKILFRTPAFLVNCVIGNFIWPIFLIVYVFLDTGKLSVITNMTQNINDPKILGLIIGIAFSITLFISGTSVIACTSISREGEAMFINKYIPMTYKEQIYSKIISSIIVNMISVVLITIILAILKFPLMLIAMIFIISTLSNIIAAVLGVVIDINRPKLNWDNEQKAVKQNLNSLISTLITLVIAALNIFAFIKLQPSLLSGFVSLTLLSLIIVLLLLYYINNKGHRTYGKIE
ncbi:hypothetical protein KQI89_10290 [Clostridium sp. MSJ-4]|uniref:ABC transporter permease n=1 Tax=Clostridium simiarum TaxID=2841506 RepID=A0ABS6F2R5_9CLOT|nr:hypothetical protein [Clostridium simiarum]MBU5592149.1 hypothetical protein [Clostridium simiarum]